MISLNGNGSHSSHPKMTKILATLGPASSKPEVMARLLKAGVNAFRLNCSHASMDELEGTVRMIRRASQTAKKAVSIVMDLQGPRLRVGRLRNGEPVELKKGARAHHFAFDVTPHDLVTAIVTEKGIVRPANGRNLARILS